MTNEVSSYWKWAVYILLGHCDLQETSHDDKNPVILYRVTMTYMAESFTLGENPVQAPCPRLDQEENDW